MKLRKSNPSESWLQKIFLSCLSLAILIFGAHSVQGDRLILAPDANTLDPKSYRASFLIRPDSGNANISWLTVSTAQSIEIEAQRQQNLGDRRALTQLNIEYPFLAELGAVPAVSFGIRDLLGTGSDHHSFYLAVARTIPLSDKQAKTFRLLKIDAGLGTERLGGLFGGIQFVLRSGLDLQLEGLRRRFNYGVGIPIAHNLQIKATGLNGSVFYGFSFSTAH